MAIPTDVMAELATLGLSKEQAQAVASMLARVEEATASASEAGKEKARARWRKWKEGHSTNVGKRLQTTASVGKRLVSEGAHVEDKTLTSEIEPQKEEQKETRAVRDVSEFDAAFPELDTERLDALKKHRRSKRGQITGHAAKLFRRDADECGLSIIEAVDTCISRNWITVKPEYFAGRPRAGPALPKPNPGLAAVDALMEKIDAVTPSETDPSSTHLRLVASAVG